MENEVICQKEVLTGNRQYRFQITIFERETVIISVGPSGCQTMMHIKREDLVKISEMLTLSTTKVGRFSLH